MAVRKVGHGGVTVPRVFDWTPTEADMAMDLKASVRQTYRHVPVTAPVTCGQEYLAAVRRAAAAEDMVRKLQRIVAGFADRIADQSELLSRLAERK